MTEKFRKTTATCYMKWLIGLTILLVGIAALAAWRFRTRVPLLLDIATKTAPKGRFYGGPFAWLSDDEYLCFGADGRMLSRYRLSSGVYTPLLKQFGPQWDGSDVQVSPNGEWLFWIKLTGPPHRSMTGTGVYMYNGPVFFRAFLTRLSDLHTRELKNVIGGQWEPDSRHLIDISPYSEGANESTVVITDVASNGVRRSLPFAPNVSSTRGNTIMVGPDRLLGFAIRNPLVPGMEKQPVKLIEYRLDKTLHITHRWEVALPHHAAFQEARISPTGDRIAWLVDTVEVAPGLAALHRLLPFIKAPSQPRQELWISRLDGTGMHLLGEAPAKVEEGYPLLVGDLRWLPNGKHLSFAYNATLYTVPTENSK